MEAQFHVFCLLPLSLVLPLRPIFASSYPPQTVGIANQAIWEDLEQINLRLLQWSAVTKSAHERARILLVAHLGQERLLAAAIMKYG